MTKLLPDTPRLLQSTVFKYFWAESKQYMAAYLTRKTLRRIASAREQYKEKGRLQIQRHNNIHRLPSIMLPWFYAGGARRNKETCSIWLLGERDGPRIMAAAG